MNYTLITGASEGIGRALAYRCAQEKYNLILVDPAGDPLESLAKELRKEYSVQVNTVVLDLLSDQAALRLWEKCQQNEWPVRILINNAGFGVWGPFADRPIEEQLSSMKLIETVMVELCHRFIPTLRDIPFSHILNIASTASFQPVPYFSVNAASAAFVLSFSRSLRQELRSNGIRVSCLCPGPTDTQFFKRAGFNAKNRNTQFLMKPEPVAEAAVRGLIANRSVIIPGFSNKVGVFISKLLPIGWTTRFLQPYFKP